MLITPENFEKYFPHDRLISVPHREMLATMLLHGLIIYAAQALFINVLALASTAVLAVEAYYIYSLIYRMWRKAGYSAKLFIIGGIIFFVLSGLLALPVRMKLILLIEG